MQHKLGATKAPKNGAYFPIKGDLLHLFAIVLFKKLSLQLGFLKLEPVLPEMAIYRTLKL